MSVDLQRRVIAEAFGIKPDDVADGSAFVGERTRYSYYLATLPSGQRVFFKATTDPKFQVNLFREALVTTLARSLDIPTKTVHPFASANNSHYVEREGIGVIALEFLEPKDWLFVSTMQELAALAPDQIDSIIEVAVHALTAFSGMLLPTTLDTDVFRHDSTADWRYRSPEHLARVWNESDVVLNRLENVFPGISEERRQWFSAVMQEGRQYGQRAGDNSEGTKGPEYLVHGDFDPYNIAVACNTAGSDQRKSLVLDFEETGKTTFGWLARFCDAANFISRCWPNPTLQQSLIRRLTEKLSQDSSPSECRSFMRGVLIFGAFYLAKYAMEREHPEHNMAVALLTGLEDNLRLVDVVVNQ